MVLDNYIHLHTFHTLQWELMSRITSVSSQISLQKLHNCGLICTCCRSTCGAVQPNEISCQVREEGREQRRQREGARGRGKERERDSEKGRERGRERGNEL